VILVGRSTSGIADACVPSREALPLAYVALPLAARGFVSIAPDFAGRGNEGTHAYLDNHEAAIQLRDAARAAEAAASYPRTLELHPDNPDARQGLEAAVQRMRRAPAMF
jgi:hypothetical protein